MHPPLGLEPAVVRRALLCRIGNLRLAFPLETVREITRPLPIQALDGLPPYLLGATILRGIPVPVVASGPLLIGEAGPPPGRFIILKAGERSVAFAVESVTGIRDLPPETLADLPSLLRSAADSMVSTLGALDSELVVTLETAKMIPEESWALFEISQAPSLPEPSGARP